MELTEHRTKCTVQQPFTLPTDSVQWKVQCTLFGAGATDLMVSVLNMLCVNTLMLYSMQRTGCMQQRLIVP